MESGKRARQKESTRAGILRAAKEVYAEQGFSSTTSCIARRAGVSHGTIFVHFPTLEDLLIAVLQSFLEDIGGRLHGLAESGGHILDLLRAHLEVLTDYEDFYRNLISQMQSLPEEARYTVVAIQSIVSLHLAKAFARGKEEGHIKHIPTHMLCNTWMGLVHYYLHNKALFAPEGSVLQHRREEMIDSFGALIQT